MKFSISNMSMTMLEQAIGMVSPALVDSDKPNDPGRYLRIRAEDTLFGLLVARQEISVEVALKFEAGTLQDKGEVTMEGDNLVSLIPLLKEPKIDVEFKQSKAAAGAEDTVSETGRLTLSYKGKKERKRGFSFPCVDVKLSDPKSETLPVKALIGGADFATMIRLAGLATGDASENDRYICARVKTFNGQIDMATANGQQFAWVRYPAEEVSESSCVVRYDLLQTAMRIFRPEGKVAIKITDSSPAKLVLTQKIISGQEEVGDVTAILSTTGQEFFKFEDKLSNISWKATCSIKRQQAKNVLDRLNVLSRARMTMAFNKEDDILEFTKQDPGGEANEELPIYEFEGNPLQADVSTRHLKDAVDASSEESLKFQFSSSRSIGCMTLVGNGNGPEKPLPKVEMFFMPFKA